LKFLIIVQLYQSLNSIGDKYSNEELIKNEEEGGFPVSYFFLIFTNFFVRYAAMYFGVIKEKGEDFIRLARFKL
jgi:hypothetical protein